MERKKVICFGEVLMRLRADDDALLRQADSFKLHWGGSEANVAVALANFGVPSRLVTALPENELSRNGTGFLRRHGVEPFVIAKNGRIGTYYQETGSGVRPGSILYDRNHSAFCRLTVKDINWEQIFQDADWFHWSGITPALGTGLCRVLQAALQAAKKRRITISADLNYRSKLWQYGVHPSEVMPSLLTYCDVLLADINAACLYLGIDEQGGSPEHYQEQIRQTLPNLTFLAMTMRNSEDSQHTYCGYLQSRSAHVKSKVFELREIKERIGAGDAFMAGLIFSLTQCWDLQRAIDFATACGAVKHSIQGDALAVAQGFVEAILIQKPNGSILR